MKSGYAFLAHKRLESMGSKPSSSFAPSCSMWRKFWTVPTLPKIRVFMWKVIQNWVACQDNLVRRKCGNNSMCPICENAKETMEHVLFHCPWSRAVWFGSNKAYWVLHKEIGAVDKWMESLICGDLAKETSREDLGEIFQLCWAIWKARNNWIFNNKTPNPEEVIEQAARANSDYLAAMFVNVANSNPLAVVHHKWEPPPIACVKINSDGAFHSSRSWAAFGVIARDNGGSAQWWHFGKIRVSSALAIEAWALRIACAMAHEKEIVRAIFETDCKNLIDYVNGDILNCPWEILSVVEDIHSWASNRSWSFNWCKRSCNSAAHWIASNCLDHRAFLPLGCIPPKLESILSSDLS